jgi:hypothetical protein
VSERDVRRSTFDVRRSTFDVVTERRKATAYSAAFDESFGSRAIRISTMVSKNRAEDVLPYLLTPS